MQRENNEHLIVIRYPKVEKRETILNKVASMQAHFHSTKKMDFDLIKLFFSLTSEIHIEKKKLLT